tara:strand:- start:391 stop:528 length:138 start_codon:yes stop_codon:yes gene_type:complete
VLFACRICAVENQKEVEKEDNRASLKMALRYHFTEGVYEKILKHF